jgi:glycerol-3-phosphate acyltransferase PlsY
MMSVAGLLVLSYLLGAIPSALVAGRLARGIDIRAHGSGNMGATNTFRVLGARWGVLVGLADLVKGFIPPYLLAPPAAAATGLDVLYVQIVFGLAAIFGHVFTVFAAFRGGKGVLAGLGVMLALMPLEAGLAVLVFAVVFAAFRIVSLGSIIATLALNVIVLLKKIVLGGVVREELVLTCILLLILVLITHRSNIKRLLAGIEPTFKRPRS